MEVDFTALSVNKELNLLLTERLGCFEGDYHFLVIDNTITTWSSNGYAGDVLQILYRHRSTSNDLVEGSWLVVHCYLDLLVLEYYAQRFPYAAAC